MGTTEPNGNHPSVGGAQETAAAKPPPVDRDCQKCLTYLTRALDKVGSRPQSLLRALGVISHADASNKNNEHKLYERTENGRGILISLENKIAAAADGLANQQVQVKDSNNDTSVQGTDVPLIRGNSEKTKIKSADTNDSGSVALARRFTILADEIRHSTEEILNNGAMPDVLTTSPAAESAQNQVEIPMKNNVTTIAVECQTCGSDTRAEAGARAFVKGPEPLSIVLCSNRLSSQREIDEVLVHELVHIYDVHSRKMDLRDCKQLAWSEVRAAREAECSNSLTSFTANICAKDKATVATRNMFPDEGRKCVCNVFNDAMGDLAPFDGTSNNDFMKAGRAKGNATSVKQSADRRANFTPPREEFPFARRSDR